MSQLPDQPAPPAAPATPCGTQRPATARAGKDAAGRFTRGNTFALTTGAHSSQFWAAVEDVMRDHIDAYLHEVGHTQVSAPQSLFAMVKRGVQSEILADSGFNRIAENHGALTAHSRLRANFNVWLEAVDRVRNFQRDFAAYKAAQAPRKAQPTVDDLSDEQLVAETQHLIEQMLELRKARAAAVSKLRNVTDPDAQSVAAPSAAEEAE